MGARNYSPRNIAQATILDGLPGSMEIIPKLRPGIVD
jgi:hypothetical protein